jgi:hypothetical protein
MTALLLALSLATQTPYNWTMSCARWHEVRIGVMMDPNLDYRARSYIIRHLRTKVKERCDDVLI